MPILRHKTPAERENQLIGYLLYGEDIPGGIRFNYMGTLVGHLLAIDDLNTVKSNPKVREHNPLATEQDLDEFAQNFVPHLRNHPHDPEHNEHQADKVRMIARYNDEFAPLVAQIDFDGKSELIPGSYSKPRLLEHGGVEYIVRKIAPRVDVEQVEKHIEAGLLVEGIPRMEHIVAISYKDGITVAPKLPGSSFKELERSGNAKDVSESQLREFVASMKLASERGAKFDGQGGNIFYDSEAGFSALDLETLETDWAGSWPHALMKQIYAITRTTSSDLDYVYEVDRISAIVENIFAEEQVDGVALDFLKRAREQIADTIERLEAFEDFQAEDDTFYDWNEYTE